MRNIVFSLCYYRCVSTVLIACFLCRSFADEAVRDRSVNDIVLKDVGPFLAILATTLICFEVAGSSFFFLGSGQDVNLRNMGSYMTIWLDSGSMLTLQETLGHPDWDRGDYPMHLMHRSSKGTDETAILAGRPHRRLQEQFTEKTDSDEFFCSGFVTLFFFLAVLILTNLLIAQVGGLTCPTGTHLTWS